MTKKESERLLENGLAEIDMNISEKDHISDGEAKEVPANTITVRYYIKEGKMQSFVERIKSGASVDDCIFEGLINVTVQKNA